MTPILFLSGAGLTAWIWDEVGSGLSAETRVAPRPPADASLDTYVDHALAAADGWDTFDVVAHSVGGVVGAALLARAPERVTGFLAVSACIPEPGGSFLASLPFPQRRVLGLVTRIVGTKPPAKAIRSGVCSGVSTELADRIVAGFEPESRRLYADPVPARSFPDRSAYLLTTQDREFTPALQETYAGQLGAPVERVETGHLPMLEKPDAVAAVIGRVLA